MKYRLLKDLPFAKAGTEVTIMAGEAITYDGGVYSCDYVGICELVKDGWVEEFKPREWWVNVNGKGVSYLYEGKSEAEVFAEGRNTIRVREVIEK